MCRKLLLKALQDSTDYSLRCWGAFFYKQLLPTHSMWHVACGMDRTSGGTLHNNISLCHQNLIFSPACPTSALIMYIPICSILNLYSVPLCWERMWSLSSLSPPPPTIPGGGGHLAQERRVGILPPSVGLRRMWTVGYFWISWLKSQIFPTDMHTGLSTTRGVVEGEGGEGKSCQIRVTTGRSQQSNKITSSHQLKTC